MGVKTVNTLTLSAGSHSTAGDLGVTLFRPISMFTVGPTTEVQTDSSRATGLTWPWPKSRATPA
jgi:hypothetical protein